MSPTTESARPRSSIRRQPSFGYADGPAPIELADPAMDPLDRIVGRAAVDPHFRHQLLTTPAMALTGEPLPAGLMLALSSIRAPNLADFARQAIEAQSRVTSRLRLVGGPAAWSAPATAVSISGYDLPLAAGA